MDKISERMVLRDDGLSCPKDKTHPITEFTPTHIWCHICQHSVSTVKGEEVKDES